MKKKIFYLGVLALPFLFGACADDMLTTEGNQTSVSADGKVINLGDDFRVFASRAGGSDVNTRGEWISKGGTSFYWMPEGLVTEANTTVSGSNDLSKGTFTIKDLSVSGVKADKVGLCWVGDGAPADNIYTNYEFVHDGWLEANATEMENSPVECIDGVYIYNWNFITIDAAKTAGVTLTVTKPAGNRVSGTLSAAVDAYTRGASAGKQKTITNLELGRGTFKTENKSIFTGNYIAYYPYNKDMVEADKLQATAPVAMDYVVGETNRLLSAGQYTFSCGYMSTPILGGSNASSLKMRQVSGLLSLEIPVAEVTGKNIMHMFLVDAEGRFVSSEKLTAAGIQAATSAATSAAVDQAFKASASEIKNEQVVRADFKDASGAAALTAFSSDPMDTDPSVIFPLLPTNNISRVDVILVDKNGKARMTSITDGITITSELAQVKDLSNTLDYTFTDAPYIAWDQASLVTAMTNAGTTQILLLGDVVISSDLTIENENITGEWKGRKIGKLIVAGVDSGNTPTTLTVKNSTIDCDIDIEGKGCCHNAAGKLVATAMEYTAGEYITGVNTITNNGVVEFAPSTSTLTINNIYGDIINEPLKYVGNGQTDVQGKEYLIGFETEPAIIDIKTLSTVNIYGKVENKTSSTQDGSTRVDALITLEKRDASSYPDNNQDARLIVTTNNVVTGNLINDATIENRATIANNAGSASAIKNTELATFVNMIGGQLNGYKLEKNANSNFISEVDNSIDSRYVTALNDRLTNIIKIVKKNAKYNSNQHAMYFSMEEVAKTGTRENLKFIIDAENVLFVGKKNIPAVAVDEYEYTIREATIGALELTSNATGFQINPRGIVYQDAKGGNIDPASLYVKNATYNETHKAVSGKLVNTLYPVAIPAVYTQANSTMLMASCADVVSTEKVRFEVVGDIIVEGTVNFGAFASSKFNTPKLAVNGNVTLNGSAEFTFDKKVTENTILGNFSIAAGATANFQSDVKVKVGQSLTAVNGVINNLGTFNIESMSIINSPAVVYCKQYNLTGGTWLNGGRPTPFNAGGVEESDYTWDF